MKKSIVVLSALMSIALASCGDKDATSSAPKIEAGEVVPPPAGKTWSEVVTQTKDGGYRMGNPAAKIQVTEFASLTCPHCRDFSEQSHADVEAMVNTGKMSFELRPYVRDPLDMSLFLLAGCNGPEAFYPLARQLFANQEAMFGQIQAAGNKAEALSKEPPAKQFAGMAELAGLMDFVKQRGLPEDKARQCLADTKRVDAAVKGVEAANSQYEISGTPTVVINGSVVPDGAQWQVVKNNLKEAGL